MRNDDTSLFKRIEILLLSVDDRCKLKSFEIDFFIEKANIHKIQKNQINNSELLTKKERKLIQRIFKKIQ